MKQLNMQSALKRYNRIMMDICCEHCTIGTRFSEDTEGWNIRDMVAEADYWLSCYYESGNVRCDSRYDGKEEYKTWQSETGKLKRFIEAYKPFIYSYRCVSGHCSQYDNRGV